MGKGKLPRLAALRLTTLARWAHSVAGETCCEVPVRTAFFRYGMLDLCRKRRGMGFQGYVRKQNHAVYVLV